MFLYRIDKNTQERFKKTSIAPSRLINTQILDFIFNSKVSLKFIVILNELNYIRFIVILGGAYRCIFAWCTSSGNFIVQKI